ncbi:MAG: hypothetical protein CSA53_02040 [Gammaproteobacteria bacterium]|nr:MAG: hypothetical protein CSA53_02040 [Gammaproteobacteria bacterium]
MGVSSYFEFVTTLFAWVMYDNLWQVLNDSGLVYIPILAMVLRHIIESRKGGDDEGSAPIQSLKKIETDFAVMMVVIILAAIPMVSVQLGEMQYKRPAINCSVAAGVIDGGEATGTTLDHTMTSFGGHVGRAPLWWAFLHIVSKSITSASIAAIPCSYDIASINTKISSAKIKNTAIARDVEAFFYDCYTAASSKYLSQASSALNDEQRAKIAWIGSKYFLNTAGYYDTFYSRAARPDWPFDPVRDRGFEDDRTVDGMGGHPTCKQWWQHGTLGIRHKVLDEVDPALLSEFTASNGLLARSARFSDSTLSATEREDIFLRRYLVFNTRSGSATVPLNMANSYRVTGYDRAQAQAAELLDENVGWMQKLRGAASGMLGAVSDVFKDNLANASIVVGGLLGAPAAVAEGKVIRDSVSLFQGLILMVMVVVLPFLLLICQYRVATVLTLSVIMFGLHFLSFIWAVAFWADNNLMAAMASNGGAGGVFAVASSPLQAMSVEWMSRFFYIYFPALFMTMMGWAGIQFGSLASGISGQMSSVTAPAKYGANAIVSAAAVGATGGAGKGVAVGVSKGAS